MADRTEILKASEKILKRVSVKVKRHTDKWDFPNWLVNHIHVKKGKYRGLYRFDGYEPYFEIVRQMHLFPENWFLKGTQIGFSTLMIGWNLYLPYWKGLDCGYALPDKVMIKPFMKTRFGDEQIEEHPELKEIYEMHESDMYYQAERNYLYFLGANVLSEGMSRPMEQISLDEVTIISKEQIEMMEDRLGAASFGQLNGFAMEIYPQGPADEGFQRGRQNVMIFKCPHCGHEQNLEEIFYQSSMDREPVPRCVKQIDGHWQIVCEKCGKPYSRKENGRWVAKNTKEKFINSWRIPQLIFEGLSLDRIMRRWIKSHGKKATRAHLHSTILAIPDAGDLQGIQKEDIKRAKFDFQMKRTAKWTVGGADVGNTCHVIMGDLVNDRLRYLWFQTVNSDNMVEEIAKLIRSMNCRKFVIDYKPFTPEVRKLQRMFPGIVVAHEYREGGLRENEKEYLDEIFDFVEEEREEALDDYDDLFQADPPRIMLPARVYEFGRGEIDIEDSEFAAHHYRGSQKDEVEDKRLGKKIYKHKKNIPNHYYMAGNYMKTALKLLLKDASGFIGLIPIFGTLEP